MDYFGERSEYYGGDSRIGNGRRDSETQEDGQKVEGLFVDVWGAVGFVFLGHWC